MTTGTMSSFIPIKQAERRAGTRERLAGALLFILAAQFMTVIMLGASMAPGYDLSGGAISDLGVIDETALLFNVSLVAVGALNVAAGAILFRTTGRRSILAVSTVAGLGAAGAGLVPLNVSDLHGIFALVAFLFFNLEALVGARSVTGPIRIASWVAGLVGIGFVLLMAIGDAGNPGVFGAIGHGGAERMIVYPVMLWMLAFGGYLMAVRPDGTIGTLPDREGPKAHRSRKA
jgi:hypothetical membrane protein